MKQVLTGEKLSTELKNSTLTSKLINQDDHGKSFNLNGEEVKLAIQKI